MKNFVIFILVLLAVLICLNKAAGAIESNDIVAQRAFDVQPVITDSQDSTGIFLFIFVLVSTTVAVSFVLGTRHFDW